MATKVKAANFSPEQVSMLKTEYLAKPGKETVERLAKELGRSTRSIIAKLVNLGVYAKAAKPEAGKADGVKKADLVEAIAEELGENAELFDSLEAATKPTLEKILAALKAR